MAGSTNGHGFAVDRRFKKEIESVGDERRDGARERGEDERDHVHGDERKEEEDEELDSGEHEHEAARPYFRDDTRRVGKDGKGREGSRRDDEPRVLLGHERREIRREDIDDEIEVR